jgi:hypothetical protein
MFEIFLFEIKYRLKDPQLGPPFCILMLFGLIVSIGGNGPASEKVFVFSYCHCYHVKFSVFGIMLSSAIMGVPVYRDIEHKTENYFFISHLKKGYLLGRFFLSMILFGEFRLHLGLIHRFYDWSHGYEE